jgi:hypothetical protein
MQVSEKYIKKVFDEVCERFTEEECFDGELTPWESLEPKIKQRFIEDFHTVSERVITNLTFRGASFTHDDFVDGAFYVMLPSIIYMLEGDRTIYITIDIKPEDCDGKYYYMYILGPPDDPTAPLEWWSEDDVYGEDLLHRLFNGRRVMEGCAEIDPMPIEDIKRICAANNIIIHEIVQGFKEDY